jgi:hypothetical protein
VRLFEIGFQLADFAPRVEVVIGELSLLEVDNFSQLAKQKREGPPHVDDMHCHVEAIQHQDASTEPVRG